MPFEMSDLRLMIFAEDREFGWGGISDEHELEEAFECGIDGFRLFHEGAFREAPSGFNECGFVHGGEGLERGVGPGVTDGTGLSSGSVKCGEEWRIACPFPEGVKASSPEGFSVVLDVGIAAKLLPEAVGLVGFHGGATDFWNEQTARGEGLVTKGFCGEAEPWGAREEDVVGIFADAFGFGGLGLAIGCAGDDGAQEGTDVPTCFAEVRSKPVEKFGMRGWGALGPEIFGSTDQACSEDHLPELIDDDAFGQGIVVRDDPFCEVESGGASTVWELREECGDGGLHGGAELVVFASEEHMRRARGRHLFHDHDGWKGAGEFAEFTLEGVEFQEGFANLGICGGLEEAGVKRCELRWGAERGRDGGDGFWCIGTGEDECLLVGKAFGMDGEVADGAVKPGGGASAGTDAERVGVLEGLVECVEKDFGGLGFSVEMDSHPVCETGSVVGDGDVRPLVLRDGCLGPDSESVVEPSFGERDEESSVLELDGIALVLGGGRVGVLGLCCFR